MADKKSALETALAQIEKQYGKGAIMRLGQTSELNVEAIHTGSVSLDIATGVGGLPKGRIVEIYGPESSGKTTVALHCIAEAQKAGGEAAFIDAEHALDPVYAKALGVDIDSLLVSQPDTGEDALSIAEALARSGALDIIVQISRYRDGSRRISSICEIEFDYEARACRIAPLYTRENLSGTGEWIAPPCWLRLAQEDGIITAEEVQTWLQATCLLPPAA